MANPLKPADAKPDCPEVLDIHMESDRDDAHLTIVAAIRVKEKMELPKK